MTYECILDDPVPEVGYLVWYLNNGLIVFLEYGPNISSTNEPTQNPDGYVQLTNNGSSVYTSQLSFVVTAELDQQSIRCVHDNGTDESIIGNQTISIIKGIAIIVSVINFYIIIIMLYINIQSE